MKKPFFPICLICTILFTMNISHAFVYTFQPKPPDMQDLDHYYYYSWLIKWNLPTGEEIQDAELRFTNIYDWVKEGDDHLYTHLLDDPPTLKTQISYNLWRGYDNQLGGDDWAKQGTLVGVWSDDQGGKPRIPPYDLVYDFGSLGLLDELITYSSDGKFGFGIDPDCHYYNEKITFTITTQSVPEPSALFLLGFGLIGLSFLGFKRNKKDN